MNASAYTYYRNGAAGEWSYRNNLEVFERFRLRPRVMVDITKIESTLPTTILGHKFSAPFFISPCARGGYAHPDGELNLVKGAAAGNILYMPALYASKSIEDIYAARVNNGSSPQVLFQQVYLTDNDTETQQLFSRIEKAGPKAIMLTVDSAADGNSLGSVPQAQQHDQTTDHPERHPNGRRCTSCSREWSQGIHDLEPWRTPARHVAVIA
jgi:isopentenyl diphosphate isomerase/L-lactate dehydrogenase-like FMN-dependent dehydrogenase